MDDLIVFGVGLVAGGFSTAWALLVLSIANNRPPAPPAAPERSNGR